MIAFFRFFLVITFSITLFTGCFRGSSINQPNTPSSGPITTGDRVWVDMTVTSPRFSGIVWDTTDQSIASGQTQYPLTRKTFGPEMKEISMIDNGILSLDIQQSLLGKNVGDEIIVMVSPSLTKQAQYAPANTTSLPGALFDRAGITPRVGDIRLVEEKRGVIKEIQGDRPNHQYIVDLNPWDTYMELEYRITIRQIGGKKYQGK